MAALGIPQLRRLEVMTARRRAIAAAYNNAGDTAEVELPPDRSD